MTDVEYLPEGHRESKLAEVQPALEWHRHLSGRKRNCRNTRPSDRFGVIAVTSAGVWPTG